MKKITALLVSLIMSCAVMAGCSDSSSSSSSKADSTSKAETSAAADESTARILSQRSIQRRYRARALLST